MKIINFKIIGKIWIATIDGIKYSGCGICSANEAFNEFIKIIK